MNRPLTLSPTGTPTGTPTTSLVGNPNARGTSRAARHPIPNLMNGRCPSFIQTGAPAPQGRGLKQPTGVSPSVAAARSACARISHGGGRADTQRRCPSFIPTQAQRARRQRRELLGAVLCLLPGAYALAHIAQGWLMGAMA